MSRSSLLLVACLVAACSAKALPPTEDAGEDAAVAMDSGAADADAGATDADFDGGPDARDALVDAPSADADAGDAGDGAPPPISTGGSGGVTCTGSGTLASGRTYCVGALGGSEFKLVEPPPAPGPLRVLAFLHGDGALAYQDDSALEALLPWADAHNALVLAVRSPNACAWWQHPTQTDCTPSAPFVPDLDGLNADALRAVLDGVRRGYDVSNGPAFYYGASGGSVFLTLSFLRRFGDLYPGYYALNCGGERSARPFAWNTADPAKRGPTRLSFTYGDRDFLRPDIEVAIPHFTSLGFPTDALLLPDTEHCAFDTSARALAVFSAALGE